MKVGVSYNVFDGEELLEASIRSIRDSVDFISVVYQTTSNFGEECSDKLIPLIDRLYKEKLIDQPFKYNPNTSGGHSNELNKRNLGLSLSLENGCTHHMSMDTDEFYTFDQFEALKVKMIEGDYDSSACQMVTYYKEPIYRIEPKEEYYVPLLYKINMNSFYTFNAAFPVLTDPTRRIDSHKTLILKREEIEMHHMSYIRDDISKKLNNSSAKVNFRDVNKIVDYFNTWEYPKQALMGGATDRYYDVVKTEKLFEI